LADWFQYAVTSDSLTLLFCAGLFGFGVFAHNGVLVLVWWCCVFVAPRGTINSLPVDNGCRGNWRRFNRSRKPQRETKPTKVEKLMALIVYRIERRNITYKVTSDRLSAFVHEKQWNLIVHAGCVVGSSVVGLKV
jgi:hypothetical protein